MSAHHEFCSTSHPETRVISGPPLDPEMRRPGQTDTLCAPLRPDFADRGRWLPSARTGYRIGAARTRLRGGPWSRSRRPAPLEVAIRVRGAARGHALPPSIHDAAGAGYGPSSHEFPPPLVAR